MKRKTTTKYGKRKNEKLLRNTENKKMKRKTTTKYGKRKNEKLLRNTENEKMKKNYYEIRKQVNQCD